ncbi:MAG: glycoside hydrolase family 3 C-terminal domain-containing protein [Bacilli bacterium]|nr:glycoside hydrolase family 3 C-terminal domain-containing protein [Bacilli bacterium]
MKKKLLIPIFLGALAVPLCIQQQAEGLNAQFIGEYSSRNDYIVAGSALNAQICDEGFVLLKNEGNFLPMVGNEKISVVGKSSTNLVRGGGGSGSGRVNGESDIDLQKSLKDAGFELNADLTAFYKSEERSGKGRSNGNDGWKGNSQVQIGETPLSLYGEDLLATLDEYNDCAIQVISREGSEGCDVKAIDARDFDPRNAHTGGNNQNTPDDPISDRHALQLSKNEEDLFNELHEHTDNIIILINSGNIFQCNLFENDPAVKAIIWMGNPGAVGTGAIGRILNGDVNPSGRTVDTWARDFTLDPTYQNFSDNAQTNDQIIKANDTSWFGKTETYAPQDTMFTADGDPVLSYGTDKNYKDHDAPRWVDEDAKVVQGGLNGVKPSAYVSYEEGVYVDYRYYETRYADMAKKSKGKADKWYNGKDKEKGGVIYPFGYGLSYTRFEQEVVSCNYANKMITSGNAHIEVEVKVTNTGGMPGKEVVQLYWRAPYKKGGIEKADHVLCAFAKTDMLQPSESQTLKLDFYSQDVANYDYNDANGNGFKGYELDPGKYEILLSKNAHEAYDSIKLMVGENGIQYENDRITGHKVENRFTDRGFYNCLPAEEDIEFEQMSRSDLVKTFPHHPTFESRSLKDGSRVEEFFNHEVTLADIELDNPTGEYIPTVLKKTKEEIQALGYSQATSTNISDIKFPDMYNLDIDDPKWDLFLNQLTYDELLKFTDGTTQNPSISRLNKPETGSSDGPSQFLIIWWAGAPIVAATFNVELAKKQGEMVGMEAHIQGTYGWAGPAVNLHRSPFGGRNFEYYSADPFLMGKMAGQVVAGATDKGIYCYFKHFVVNDQEKNREGTSTFLTEQVLREIYLRPFQIVVQEGRATGIMSSYNRLGLMETAASYPLLTEVLREEWGFKGHIISDMTHSGNGSVNFKCYENVNWRILIGCNQQLDQRGFNGNIEAKWSPTLGCPTFKIGNDTVEAYSWWYALRKAAKGTLYSCARSGATSTSMIKPLTGTQLSNTERDVFVGAINEDVDIQITLPTTFGGKNIADSSIAIDPTTPLPEGLSLNNNAISGKVDAAVNQFVHLIINLTYSDQSKATVGYSFKLYIPAGAIDAESTEMPAGKGGCGGSIGVTMIGVATLGLLAFGALFLNKKRRVTE